MKIELTFQAHISTYVISTTRGQVFRSLRNDLKIEKSSKIRLTYFLPQWRSYQRFFIPLNHINNCFTIDFFKQLARMYIWNTVDLLENYRRIIYKSDVSEYFRLMHILVHVLHRFSDYTIMRCHMHVGMHVTQETMRGCSTTHGSPSPDWKFRLTNSAL